MWKRRNKRGKDDDGFEEWGGYMAAKVSKLNNQFDQDTHNAKPQSNIFQNVAIFVNGYTDPPADRLKNLMAAHGGTFHLYQNNGFVGATTHIIASNLANVKINKNANSIPIVKAGWITHSIAAGRLLDYTKYLLHTNANSRQPAINFGPVTKPEEKATNNSRVLPASNPHFITEFYNNSRLHLISTLASELKSFVNDLRQASEATFSARNDLKGLTNAGSMSINRTVIMHIDMDCFFVSVGLRNRPELRGYPVAVTHAKNSHLGKDYVSNETSTFRRDPRHSMSEIASCSYEARECGIKNGMSVGTALKLCPNLNTIAYDFQGYREVSKILYETVASYTFDIEAVSCDEMYVDVSPILYETKIDVEHWANHIRGKIMSVTGCPCSTGFGANRLQARLATKKAKPGGQFYLKSDQVEEYMSKLPVTNLPGVGYATLSKLKDAGIETCGDLRNLSLTILQSKLGQKTASLLLDQACGVDKRPLNYMHERKSISVNVNYGIRFKSKEEAHRFLESLSKEVWNRLIETKMRSKCLTLKLLVRAPEAPLETAKYLGCGICNPINRSSTLSTYFANSASIYKEVKIIFDRTGVPPQELRGIAIHLGNLERHLPINGSLSNFLIENSSTGKEAIEVNKKNENGKIIRSKECINLDNTLKRESINIQRGLYLTDCFQLQKQRSPPEIPKNKNTQQNVPEDTHEQIDEEGRLNNSHKLKWSLSKKNDIKQPMKAYEQEIFFQELNSNTLKSVIKEWLISSEKPSQFDVKVISKYLKNLAEQGKIEMLWVILSLIRRNINQNNLSHWQNAFKIIITTVQESMVVRYGYMLSLQQNFR